MGSAAEGLFGRRMASVLGLAVAAVVMLVLMVGAASAGAATVTSLVGAEDNFGYGGTANPGCVFFDNAGSEDIINGQKVFDNVSLANSGDVGPWTHTFDLTGLTATSAELQVREKFSDPGAGATITIDGQTQSFYANGTSTCGNAIVQTFAVPVADLAGGHVDVTLHQNGDYIALDWSKLVIQTGSSDTAPNKPDAPTSNQSQNADGNQTVSWTAATDGDGDLIDHYVLQHERSDQSSYSDVGSVSGTSYHFGTDGASEGEGTWTYRVIAVDSNGTSSDPSDASTAVVVDQTKPNAPTVAADGTGSQSLSYTSGGGTTWYKNSELVDVTGNGDPVNVADGSLGTGVDATSFTSPFSVTANGTTSGITRTVKDNVGNESASSSALTAHVDAANPTVSYSDCPTGSVPAGTAVTVHWAAADGESGLASAASGSNALNTGSIGAKHVNAPQATDNVGHTSANPGATCNYTVVYNFDGFYKGVSNGAWNKVQPGSAVPLKFSLDGPPVANQNDTLGLNVFASSPAQPVITKVTCPSNLTSSTTTTDTATTSKLLYDPAADQYNYVWKTPSTFSGCYTLQMTFNDSIGTQSKQLRFYFK